jgi:hypothetical protein
MSPSDSCSRGGGDDVAAEVRRRFGFDEVVVGDRRRVDTRRLVTQLQALGHTVTLQKPAA